MTQAEWEKLTLDQKVTRIDENLIKMRNAHFIQLSLVILGALGVLAIVESRAKHYLKEVKNGLIK